MTEPATQPQPTTHTLEVPGAVLTYDARRNEASSEPPLMLIGSPMGAGGFATLSGYFTDRTIVTYANEPVGKYAEAPSPTILQSSVPSASWNCDGVMFSLMPRA